ncbi:hypothetical protein [Streptomyces sp. NPDC002265]|uniref:hypothetical protein n=1 Tax=Streptomyces sp. NPDC002265 TaxID=3154415 RepID=UPI00332AD47A
MTATVLTVGAVILPLAGTAAAAPAPTLKASPVHASSLLEPRDHDGHRNHGGDHDRGRGWDDRGRGWDDRGRGWDDRGRGWDDRGRGWDDRGRGWDWDGYRDHGRGCYWVYQRDWGHHRNHWVCVPKWRR